MFQTGDIILMRSGTWYGELILYFMRIFQTDPVQYSHVMICVDNEKVLNSDIDKLYLENIKDCLKDCENYLILRYKNLKPEQIKKVGVLAKGLTNLSYSKIRILLQLLDHIFYTNKFTRLLKNKKDQVCSSSVAWIYERICGLKFNGVKWFSVEPDDIHDEFFLNINDWTVVKIKE